MEDVMHEHLDNTISLSSNRATFNSSQNITLPINMRFNDGHILAIAVYTILLIFSSVANIRVLTLIAKRQKKNPTRINTMFMHLAIADLLVTCLMMPLEIGWSSTVSWEAGNFMCRTMAFFRMFGLVLSSFILICISIDRYFAILKPLNLASLDQREKIMLIGAWVGAAVCSLPQIYVFHVEHHMVYTWYTQCVTDHAFPSYGYEIGYNVFGMVVLYAAPLVVIIFSYTCILLEICRRMRNPGGADSITRSSLPFLSKAKIRTLKMTIIIVLAFFICWTPYFVMCLWYWIDKTSAETVDERIQKGLFLFACTNSCMNPLVYGIFNIRSFRKAMKREVRLRTFTHSNSRTTCIATPTSESRLSGFEIKTLPS